MSNDIKNELEILIGAGTHVINVVSYEWLRTEAALVEISEENSLPIFNWCASFGLTKYNEDGLKEQSGNSLSDPIELLKTFHGNDFDEGIMILDDFHPYLDPQNHQVIRWVREYTRLNIDSRKFLILLSPVSCIPIELQKDVPIVDIPLPDSKVLKQTLEHVADQYELREIMGEVDFHPDLIDSALGLTTDQAKRAFSKAAVKEKKITIKEIPLIISEKEQIIKEGNLLEYFHPIEGFSGVGGMDNLKEWLIKRGNGFTEDARIYGLTPPKGVLLLGVQGCGKSLTAKAIAQEWQIPLLKFDIGRVFSHLVGQSESNIRNALQVAEALAPSILWIDEIEKGLSGVGSSDITDGGTTSRVFGTILTWMQEKEKPVFVIATANDISKLPPELLRKGRFDEIFFVDLPSKEERKTIFEIHIEKKGRNKKDFSIDKCVEQTIGFSGAEIEEIVNEALYIAFNDGQREMQDEDLYQAIKDLTPLSSTMKEVISDLRIWADVRARSASSQKPEPLAVRTKEVPILKQEQKNIFIKKQKE